MLNSDIKVLICGINSQDGAYLAKYLVGFGYKVYGTSRDAEASSMNNLVKLGIRHFTELYSMDPKDLHSVYSTIHDILPDYIFNLSAQSSVGLSFSQPFETYQSNITSTLNICEAVRLVNIKIKIFNACSSEMFGTCGEDLITENSPLNPLSPYAISKASSYWTAKYYRNSYNMFITNGILFNHESPLRPERFVTQKIIQSAIRIAKGSKEKLRLGNLNILRDWGWAPEYVEVIWKTMQLTYADDFIIATGKTSSLQDFVINSFNYFGLNWINYVEIDENLLRPTDLIGSYADNSKICTAIGWQPQYLMPDIINMLIEESN